MDISIKNHILSYGVFTVILLIVIALWRPLSHEQAIWVNTPPVPSDNSALGFSLGDPQFSYRSYGLMLQNIGNTGGNDTALRDYDFERLGQWFWLQHRLDPRSNYVPLLAAYYFGGTQNPDQLDPVIEYLAIIGQRKEDQKWRWLAHAAFLARYKQKDLDKALELAYILSSMQNRVNLPIWAAQMPAFIMSEKGDKEAALDMLLGILRDGSDDMSPSEINFTISYICEQILTEAEAATYPLCEDMDKH